MDIEQGSTVNSEEEEEEEEEEDDNIMKDYLHIPDHIHNKKKRKHENKKDDSDDDDEISIYEEDEEEEDEDINNDNNEEEYNKYYNRNNNVIINNNNDINNNIINNNNYYQKIVNLQESLQLKIANNDKKKKKHVIVDTDTIFSKSYQEKKRKKQKRIIGKINPFENDNNIQEDLINDDNNTIEKKTEEEKEIEIDSNVLLSYHKAVEKHIQLIQKIDKTFIYTSSNQIYNSWHLYLIYRDTLQKVMLNVCYVLIYARKYKLFLNEEDVIWNNNDGYNLNQRKKILNMSSSPNKLLKWTSDKIKQWHKKSIDPKEIYLSEPQFELNCTWIYHDQHGQRPKGIYVMFSPFNVVTKHLAPNNSKIREDLNTQLTRTDVQITRIIFVRVGPVKTEPKAKFKTPFQEIINDFDEKGIRIETIPWELFFINILKSKLVPEFTEIKQSELPEYMILEEEKREIENKLNKKTNLLELSILNKKEVKVSKIRTIPNNDVIVLLYGWLPNTLIRVRSWILSLQQTVDFLRVSNLSTSQIRKLQADIDSKKETDEDDNNNNNNNNDSTEVVKNNNDDDDEIIIINNSNK